MKSTLIYVVFCVASGVGFWWIGRREPTILREIAVELVARAVEIMLYNYANFIYPARQPSKSIAIQPSQS